MLKLSVIGNLTRDPEMRQTGGGTDVCTFTVAVNRRVNGEDKTSYIRVSAFGNRARPCAQYLEKGRKIYACGTPSAHAYTNRAGEIVAEMEIIADEVEFLSSRSDAQSARTAHMPPAPAAPSDGFTPVDDEAELPF